MEPRIQYAKTSDGVNIAYAELGEGQPLVAFGGPGFIHAELNWRMYVNILPPLASRFRLVWHDPRGTSLSDRDAVDFSIEALVRDLEAVVDRAGLESFVLAAWTNACPIAITYAAENSERVSHFVLCDAWTRFDDIKDAPAYKASVAMLELDWQLFTETFGQVFWAHAEPEFGRQMATLMQECAEPEAHRAMWKAWEGYDAEACLAEITAPTLIVHNKNNRLFPLSVSRRMAAALPDARLTLIDDITYAPVPDLIESFVSTRAPSRAETTDIPSGTAVILFADIANSTALTERLGDAAFRERARSLDERLRAAIGEARGAAINGKLLGDGVLAVFASARDAIECGLACNAAGADVELPMHLGIHAGDVIREDDNIYGGAVNIAARIADASAAGEVLVSQTVRDLARTSAGVDFEDRGEHLLKGIAELQRLYAVSRSS
jgi:class 3 adenylate cyclase